MKFCTGCRRFTGGEPTFCGNCGRTYDVRLCPRLHVNARGAEVCTQCGSRDLTQAQPPTSLPTALTLRMVGVLPGVILLVLTVMVGIGFVRVLLTDSVVQGQLLVMLLFVGMGWWLYVQLPPGMRQVARWGWRGVKKLTRRR